MLTSQRCNVENSVVWAHMCETLHRNRSPFGGVNCPPVDWTHYWQWKRRMSGAQPAKLFHPTSNMRINQSVFPQVMYDMYVWVQQTMMATLLPLKEWVTSVSTMDRSSRNN